ncbi:twin transmembrane helix small protein [Denitratisoma sp. agr-D3]
MYTLLVVLMLLGIVFSLFSGLFFVYRDRGAGSRVAKALTVRISLSIALFIGLCLAFWLRQHS